MVVRAHSQVVRYALRYAFRKVTIKVGCTSADRCDHEGGDSRPQGYNPFVAARGQGSQKVFQPEGEVAASCDVVENELERPGPGQTHHGLHDHRAANQCQAPSIRPNELADESDHAGKRKVNSAATIPSRSLGPEKHFRGSQWLRVWNRGNAGPS